MSDELVKKVEDYVSRTHNRRIEAGYLVALVYQRVADIRALAELGDETLVDCGLRLLDGELEFETLARRKVLSAEGPKEGTNLC